MTSLFGGIEETFGSVKSSWQPAKKATGIKRAKKNFVIFFSVVFMMIGFKVKTVLLLKF